MSNGERSERPDEPAETAETATEPEPSAEAEHSLLELLLAEQDAPPPPLASHVNGLVLGRIVAIEGPGAVRVTFAGTPEQGFSARALVPLQEEDRGQEVALMFENGDPQRPIVLGKMVSPLAGGTTEAPEAVADGRRVEINATEEIVLRCGESSITLTRAGKIILRGAYVLSRSSGVNRIQGGSVEIN